jgi:predicted heme/steroid binding protein
MAAEASQAVVLEGALEFKRIYLAFMWKTRRLVLSVTGFLSRFKGNGFAELCESFEISSETEISKVQGSTTEFTVAFEHPEKHKLYTHHVRAKSAAECDLWFETLSETKRKKVAAARQISKKELEQHHSRDDCWIAINGTVYDVSKFLVHHPGGPEFLMQQAGRDGSDPYNSAGEGWCGCLVDPAAIVIVRPSDAACRALH